MYLLFDASKPATEMHRTFPDPPLSQIFGLLGAYYLVAGLLLLSISLERTSYYQSCLSITSVSQISNSMQLNHAGDWLLYNIV